MYDVRDANAYTIRKLADGNCWMTENLALAGPKTLTAADSNVSADFTLSASNTGTWCTSNDSACDDQSMVIDTGATYGALYNWYAATAGTGTYSVSSGDVSSSICPKGWKLPSTNGSSTDFQRLYDNYNSTSKMQATDGPAFVRSGYRYGGSTNNQGSYGGYWSSTAYDSSNAYYLLLNSSGVYPAYYNDKYYGFSVRCLADDSTPGTLTVSPDTIDADTATTVDVSIPLSGDYNANISLGDTALTCSRTSTSPLSYSCSVPSTTSGTYTLTASVPSYGKTYSASITVENPVPTTMQTMTADYCANKMSVNDTLTLIDARGDNKSYTIAKLADQNCWMTQNLALGSNTNNTVLTPADSNVSTNFTIQSSAVQTSGTTGWDATSVHVYIQSGSDSGIKDAQGNNVPYGNLYNWYAATAGTGTSSMVSVNATADICPKGWRLPDGGSSTDKSFKSLDKAMGGTGENRNPDTVSRDKYRATPYLFPYSGYYNGGLYAQGSNGHWWSRSAYTLSSYAYYFLLGGSGTVYPQNFDNNVDGFSVRCVLQ